MLSYYKPDYSPVFNNKGHTIGFIDRIHEDGEEPIIYVQLPCGFKVEFWLTELTDKEYIKRAELIKKGEK